MSRRSKDVTPPDPRQELGRAGEAIAAKHLAAAGYEILARNIRTKLGEIDLLARHGGVLVFVEVKTRRSSRFGTGAEAVDGRKQARLRNLAQAYLGPAIDRQPIQFDVVDVLVAPGKGPVVRHIAAAF